MPFLSELEYEKIEGKESFVGRPVYRLTKDLTYVYDDTYVVEKGFETDFASIPEWIIFLNPKNGKWKKASVVHDFLCKQEISKRHADRVFYYAMRDDGASVLTAYIMWTVVRINHIVTLQG